MDAHALIGRCKAGDRQALHQLYEQYRLRLLGICRQYTKGDDVAEDLLHDAFVVILTSLSQLRNDDKLESWMMTIVRNVGYHYQKQIEKEQTALQQMASENIVVEEATQMPDYDELQSLVTQLPEGYQKVFRLSVFEGLSHQEISQLLGIAPHSSSSQLSHAKRMLQTLIKQSWVLGLLLIVVPLGIWKWLHREKPETQPSATAPQLHQPQQEPLVEPTHDEPIQASVGRQPSPLIHYQTETFSQTIEEQVDTFTEKAQVDELQNETRDSVRYRTPIDSTFLLPEVERAPHILTAKAKKKSWDIRLAFNGQLGQSNTDLLPATIQTNSFASASNSFIPTDYAFSNWIDYSWSLNNAFSTDEITAETRSLMEIAAQNAMNNHGEIVARHVHRLPFTIQMTLSRQLNHQLSVETGLSYTQLNSTINTGSDQAFIQEQQHLHYLGFPLRIGWRWYDKQSFSLYSSAGAMLELPVHSSVDIRHMVNGNQTFSKTTMPDVPLQWSTTLGIGIQYDLTPHLGVYLEPSLQYFFDDGSDLNTYRTEHPLSVTLPLGLRFHW